MVSLAEAKAEVMKLRGEIEDLTMSYHQLREIETLLRRTFFILEQATGSPELKAAIDLMQRATSVARILQFSLMALRASQGDISMLVALSGLVMGSATIGTTIYGNAESISTHRMGREP